MEELKKQDVAVNVITTTSRPLANFHPNIWGDSFLHCTPPPSQAGEEEVVEKLKEEVKRELHDASNDDVQLLKMIDAIQRLGLEYQFEEEIDRALMNVSKKFQDFFEDNDDMCAVALGFRLLRQHGCRVPCNVFDKFKDGKGGFKAADVMGVLELFEATHLRVRNEDILDEANIYSRKFLESALPRLKNPAAEQVHHALHEHSNRRGLTRVEARHYISIYHHQTLLKLARLDFNLLQSMHRRELSELYRWWKDLDVPRNFPFARDRMVETYFWILGVYFEPKYALARRILCKMQGILSLLDDIFDAYATYEELQLFMEAIEGWSYTCLDTLPASCMKIHYKAMLEAFEEAEELLTKHGITVTSHRLTYGIEAMKVIARNFFTEAKWREEKYKPSSEEYMQVATATCGYTSLTIISFIGMRDVAVTKQAFDFVLSQPNIMRAASVVCRLTDDIVGYEFEKEREHIPSAVECYMEEHKISKAEAIAELKNRVDEAWKDANEAFLKPTRIPTPLLYRILNYTRVIEVMYTRGDWYTHVGPEMQNLIHQLLVNPIP